MDFYIKDDVSRLRKIIGWIVDIVVVITLAWFTVYSFGTQIKVTGHSMDPLLTADQVVLINRLSYVFGAPERFDLVVFESGNNPTNMKRIIGLPGETVQIKNGYVYINDTLLQAANGLNQVSLAGVAEKPVLLGDDEYFLLGDNRDSSDDSRFVNVGNVSEKKILGKVWFRMLPLIKIGFPSY